MKKTNKKPAKKVETEERCDKCGGPASEPHPCPYAEEIGGDCETLCNCCPNCTGECAMDI